jgi:hypothetical protein
MRLNGSLSFEVIHKSTSIATCKNVPQGTEVLELWQLFRKTIGRSRFNLDGQKTDSHKLQDLDGMQPQQLTSFIVNHITPPVGTLVQSL